MKLTVLDLPAVAGSLRAGDFVYLTGTVYTARDAAHKRLFALLDEGAPLPFALRGAVVYYAGPTPTPPGRSVGACGPTTAGRMDRYTPRLLGLGLAATIGKGARAPEVRDAVRQFRAPYLCAVGGAGALLSRCVESVREIAFPDLGCESVKEMTVRDMPLFVGYDIHGGDIFTEGRVPYRAAR